MSIIVPKGKTLTKNDKKTENRRLESQVLCVFVGFDFRQGVIAEPQCIDSFDYTACEKPDSVCNVREGWLFLDYCHGRFIYFYISVQVLRPDGKDEIAIPEYP